MGEDLKIRRILVVDDEPDLRGILLKIIKELNIECDQAGNGQEALEALRVHEYHLVVCDIMMPVMTGLECLSASQAENVKTPFVFLTGFGDSNRMLQAMRLGAIDFINKPFDVSEVVEVIFRALEIGVRRHQIHEKIEKQAPELLPQIKKQERIISLMRSHNNKKRTGS